MNCKENRNIFNLLKIYSCSDCDSYYKDEEFVIGKRKINLYYSENKCKFIDIIKEEDSIYFNPKVKLFLKDMVLNAGNILALCVNKSDINNDIIEHLLEFDLDIHIMIFCEKKSKKKL